MPTTAGQLGREGSPAASTPPRLPYIKPALIEYGTLASLTQTRTCATGYNDGTGIGCNMSFKKS